MLQRAASNAYSWWWASHVRTKQSKWLENNLEDMEEKVKHMLKIFDDDGDSFAKRAEMYYKSRPELINYVEESYKAYRALAERYEHIASELQTANQTIATVFPEHAQIAMDEEDDDGSPKASARKFPDGLPDATNISKFKMPMNTRRPQPTTEQQTKKIKARKIDGSLENKSEALNKIDELQKGILVLQTEKEFTKGLYENGLAKYWEIENRIQDMQKEVSALQEEYGVGKVIEDDEARTLMAATALKSCQETMIRLQEKREWSTEEARVENQRIKDVCEKLEILKNKYLHNQTDQQKPEKDQSEAKDASVINVEQEVGNSKEEKRELESIFQKINEHFDKNSDAAAAVTELAETIDELVTKVINLETSVSSQTALIERLKSETNELQTKMQSFEKNKETKTNDSNDLNSELKHLDNELHGIQELNKNVQNQNSSLRMHFTEAHSDFKHISEELHDVKQQDAVVGTGVLPAAMDQDPLAIKSHQDSNTEEDKHNPFVDPVNSMKGTKGSENSLDLSLRAEDGKENVSEKDNEAEHGDADEKLDSLEMKDNGVNVEAQDKASDKEDEPNWQQLFLDGIEDREKILLVEYTSALRNLKEAKKKLSEQERKSQEALIEMTLQIRELKSANVMKDEEMRSLRQKVNLLQTSHDRNSDPHFPDVENSQKPVSPSSNTPRTDADNRQVSESSGDQGAAAPSRLDNFSGAAETPTKEGTEAHTIPTGEAHTLSTVEEKFRRDIDELLEENLKFWWRFSTSFQHIQKFKSTVEDLEAEYSKFKESKKDDNRASSATDDGDTATDQPLMSDGQLIYDNLKEIKKEMAVWMEEYEQLKEELQCRRESLCSIQEEISKVSKEASECGGSVEFTSYQAAKFQGEVLNMQQENNKVVDELKLGVEHVRAAENEIEKTMAKLKEDLKLPGSRSRHGELRHSSTWTQVPLRSFIFGAKTKKQKPRIFPRIHPALLRTRVKSKPSPD